MNATVFPATTPIPTPRSNVVRENVTLLASPPPTDRTVRVLRANGEVWELGFTISACLAAPNLGGQTVFIDMFQASGFGQIFADPGVSWLVTPNGVQCDIGSSFRVS